MHPWVTAASGVLASLAPGRGGGGGGSARTAPFRPSEGQRCRKGHLSHGARRVTKRLQATVLVVWACRWDDLRLENLWVLD